MLLGPGGRSPNLEDRRGSRMAPIGIGGGLIMLILGLIFGPGIFSDNGTTTQSSYGDVSADSAREEPQVQFVSQVLDDIQDTWAGAFERAGGHYRPAKLVLFRDGTVSECGPAQSAMGPFYCPIDEKVYLDLGFFDQLERRFSAPGDFARAYVIAHELGHHTQHLQGIDARVREAQRKNPDVANQLSVRLEKVALEDVLAELGRVSGAEIQGAPREPRDITAQFDDVPLPEALHRLLGDQNFMLTYGEGNRLRRIELFGGPQEPGETSSTSPAAGSAGGPSPAAGSTMPQNLAVAISVLEQHPPVAVTGRLAAALGGNTATFHQLFDAAMHQQDAGLRTEALRASLSAFDAEPDLRSRVLTVVAGVDDVALGQALRGIAGARAEEIANQAATQAQTAELRSKALSVLQRLRTIGSPGG